MRFCVIASEATQSQTLNVRFATSPQAGIQSVFFTICVHLCNLWLILFLSVSLFFRYNHNTLYVLIFNIWFVLIMPVEAVIFDLDGTLLHTELDFDLIRRQIGISTGPILEALGHMPDADRHRAMKILDEHEAKAAGQARLNDHAPAVFEVLAQRGIKTALLTRNSRASVQTAMDRHDLKFDFVCSREDLAGKIKPSPEPVLAICAVLDVRPAEALMVGDYLFDLQSANSAGARSVLLRNDRNVEFIPFAWRVIDRLDQLIDLLD